MHRNLADLLMLFPSRGPDRLDGVVRQELACPGGTLDFWSGPSQAAMEGEPTALAMQA